MTTSTILFLVLGVIAAFLARLLAGLLTTEVAGWLPHIARSIVARAAQTIPTSQRQRWLEEWRADLVHLEDRPLAVLVHAVGIAIGARALARELAPAPARATESNGQTGDGALVAVFEKLAELTFELYDMPRRDRIWIFAIASGVVAGVVGAVITMAFVLFR